MRKAYEVWPENSVTQLNVKSNWCATKASSHIFHTATPAIVMFVQAFPLFPLQDGIHFHCQTLISSIFQNLHGNLMGSDPWVEILSCFMVQFLCTLPIQTSWVSIS
jgi:hypothetical protein